MPNKKDKAMKTIIAVIATITMFTACSKQESAEPTLEEQDKALRAFMNRPIEKIQTAREIEAAERAKEKKEQENEKK